LALAYLTFGLQQTLCPEQRQTYAYSTLYNGSLVKAYRENVTVHGMVYPYETMHQYLATKGLNLTKEFQGVDLSWLFDADTSGACRIYDANRSGATSTLGNCKANGPYGELFFLWKFYFQLFSTAFLLPSISLISPICFVNVNVLLIF
jgi:chitin synthase